MWSCTYRTSILFKPDRATVKRGNMKTLLSVFTVLRDSKNKDLVKILSKVNNDEIRDLLGYYVERRLSNDIPKRDNCACCGSMQSVYKNGKLYRHGYQVRWLGQCVGAGLLPSSFNYKGLANRLILERLQSSFDRHVTEYNNTHDVPFDPNQIVNRFNASRYQIETHRQLKSLQYQIEKTQGKIEPYKAGHGQSKLSGDTTVIKSLCHAMRWIIDYVNITDEEKRALTGTSDKSMMDNLVEKGLFDLLLENNKKVYRINSLGKYVLSREE